MYSEYQLQIGNAIDLQTIVTSSLESNLPYYLDVVHVSEMDTFKKLIFQLARFNMTSQGLSFDPADHIVEIEYRTLQEDLSFEMCYTNANANIICQSVTFMEDCDQKPILISTISKRMFMFKMLQDIDLFVSFPNKEKHVVMSGDYCFIPSLQTPILHIKILTKRSDFVSEIPEFQREVNNKRKTLRPEGSRGIPITPMEVKYRVVDNVVLNSDLCDMILYGNDNKMSISKLMEMTLSIDREHYSTFCFKRHNENKSIPLDMSLKKYAQRFSIPNIYQSEVCDWIINESEMFAAANGGWMTTRHDRYATTDLPIEKLAHVYSFVKVSFASITRHIKQSFGLDENATFNITDMFVVKYDHEKQNSLDMHDDKSTITANILLSDPTDFDGGGTYFEDGITTFLNRGGMLVHSGKIKHSGMPITRGVRYLLIAFINIVTK